jgi:repressor LexA
VFAERLKDLRKTRKMTQSQLAETLGIAKSTVSMYENNRREPDLEMLEAIADIFNVDLNSLVSKKDYTTIIPYGFQPCPPTSQRPRLGVISCGDPIDTPENFDGYDEVPNTFDCDFTLVCEGDSMVGARICDGDIVYIKQQPTIENGQIAAVLIDGVEKLLKRVYITEESIILQAENPAYPPRFYHQEDMNRVSIIGKVVGFVSRVK